MRTWLPGRMRWRASTLSDSQCLVAYDELLEVLDRPERHYRDMCDVEFTVSDGTLYILQARIGRRSPLAALRIAVAMAQDPEFPLTREEAVAPHRCVDTAAILLEAFCSCRRASAGPGSCGLARYRRRRPVPRPRPRRRHDQPWPLSSSLARRPPRRTSMG